MDSKRMRRMLFAVIFVFIVVTGVIAVVNLDAVKEKLGFSAYGQAQETAALEEAEETSGQRGGDLSAFLRDETFLMRKSSLRALRPILAEAFL